MFRYNPLMGFIGLLMMLAGAAIVVTVYAIYKDLPNRSDWVAGGAILTLVGWLLQRLFSHRKRHS